jgi:glycosyltransferase involved in cell wall biosynthesis
LIDAFALVHAQRPDSCLVLIGSAPREADVEWLKKHAAARGVLPRVIFTGAMPMRQAWERLGTAAVCVSAVPPGPLHDVSSPTKVVEYLALGLPVVANDIPDQRSLLEACGGGICVPYQTDEFAKAILRMFDAPLQTSIQARELRDRVLALRSYEVLSRQVADTLRRVKA